MKNRWLYACTENANAVKMTVRFIRNEFQMSFIDQKFFASWGAAFFCLFTLANHEYAPGFFWREFISVEIALIIFVALRFRKDVFPRTMFYRAGLLIWSALFLAYSCFSLFLLASALGRLWLLVLIPAWVVLTILLVRATVRLPDGMTAPTAKGISGFSVLGASMAGPLLYLIPKASLNFALVLIIDLLFAFATVAYFIVWLRHARV
jgi:hypothetical protein